MSRRGWHFEHAQLELCKGIRPHNGLITDARSPHSNPVSIEQFATTHANVLLGQLTAVVAYDELDDRYYVCIFTKAAATNARLLFKGPYEYSPPNAIKALLQLPSAEIGVIVNRAARTPQMNQKEWRAPQDHASRFTVCTSGGGARGNASSGANFTSGASATRQALNLDAPPAYKK